MVGWTGKIDRERMSLDHEKIYIYIESERFEFDLFMILRIFTQTKQMQKQPKRKTTLIETFYLIRKTINIFFLY
jgi:hypothetical protein